MALFGQLLEPHGYLQSLRSLVLGVVAQLQGTATPEELEFVRRELELLDRELAGGPGLLDDAEVGRYEDCVAAVYGQLGAAVRAGSAHAPREKELFLQSCAQYELERQLLGLCRRAQGVSVLTGRPALLEQAVQAHRPRRWQMAQFCQKLNLVVGAGLLCLLCEAGLTGRDGTLLLGRWAGRMGALHQRMKEAVGRCAAYFQGQAQEDLAGILAQVPLPGPAEVAAKVLTKLEKNYDWLRWAVMAWGGEPQPGPDGEPQPGPDGDQVLAQGNYITGQAACGLKVVACYSESPSSLDKGRTHQLIGDLEWKLPNPPPEVYASLEAEPARARGYLAQRMLQKLGEGLGPGVTVHVVPGKLEMRSNFPPAACLLHEYRHRLASGTVCIFG
ncbi:uncharacterized protein LOC128834252 [Malaclemys terrapin pileata]|uniref:uncharacterized protein LOC128834252 n=1 Tax=Malaclemys terrapin pileata TaxID=2991368 RepID=UPI0023A7E22D|nr:uncharacterized protein LOC128834252 [Malaclemys terrapin pileata]